MYLLTNSMDTFILYIYTIYRINIYVYCQWFSGGDGDAKKTLQMLEWKTINNHGDQTCDLPVVRQKKKKKNHFSCMCSF